MIFDIVCIIVSIVILYNFLNDIYLIEAMTYALNLIVITFDFFDRRVFQFRKLVTTNLVLF